MTSEQAQPKPRNPFRNEADAFRVVLMIFGGALVVIAVALVIEPVAGVLVGLILVGVGAWRAWGLLQEWRAWDRARRAQEE